MRSRLKKTSSEIALTRIQEALVRDLIEAADEEILDTLRELRMDPNMKESAAFAGVKFSARPQLSDFFDLDLRALLSRSKPKT